MKIFVTGGTGFIGSHLVEVLLAQDHSVTCLVRNPAKIDALFSGPKRPAIVRGDLNDLGALNAGCQNADAVFHLAGLTSARNQAEYLAINGHATRTLTKIAAKSAPDLKHFVYVSSLAAAGPSTVGQARTEEMPARPVSHYGWSKLAGEEAVRASKLPWTIVRPPTVYGPRDTEVLKLFRLAKLHVALFFGDGSQELSFIYGPDLAEGLARCLTPKTVGRTFFASHHETFTSREFSTQVYRTLKKKPNGKPVPIAVPGLVARAILFFTGTAASLARRSTLLNSDKANEFLAEAWTCSAQALAETTEWRAQTTLVEGLERTLNWYTETGWL